MLAPAFAPFANPEAIVNSKLVLAFLEAGWEAEVITRNLAEESPYNYGSVWVAPWDSLQKHTHIISYPSNTRLHRLLDTARSAIKTGYPIQGCRWARHAFELACKLHADKPFDVILSRALPDSAHLPAALFARCSGLPWLANWNDATGAKNLPPYGDGPSAALGYFENKLVNAVAQQADVLTFPSERLRRYICQYLPNGSLDKSATIPHASLRCEFVSSEHSGTFTLCHAGHLSANRNPRSFLEGLALFINDGVEKPMVKFRIIGIQNENVPELAKQYGIAEYVECIGSMSYEATLQNLFQADVNVIIEAPLLEGVYLPSKFVDYVQAGRPILAVMPAEGEVNDIISNDGGGIAVDCTSPQDIAAALKRLYKQWQQGDLNREFSSDRLYKRYAPDKIVNDYRGIFLKLIKGQ
jgi:glycosyltransferase involved in cell wall biosynthesis